MRFGGVVGNIDRPAPATTGARLFASPKSSNLATFQYMAPEQLEGREVDSRTDIFAFGSIVYEMATGKKAFEGTTQASLIAAILDREPGPIARLQPLAPPVLDHLVRQCLAKDPDDRWHSGHDVLLQLRWLQEAGTAAETRLPPGRLSTRQWVAWGVSAVLCVAAAVATTAYLRQSREPPALMPILGPSTGAGHIQTD